jgi:hypothetical protein
MSLGSVAAVLLLFILSRVRTMTDLRPVFAGIGPASARWCCTSPRSRSSSAGSGHNAPRRC